MISNNEYIVCRQDKKVFVRPAIDKLSLGLGPYAGTILTYSQVRTINNVIFLLFFLL